MTTSTPMPIRSSLITKLILAAVVLTLVACGGRDPAWEDRPAPAPAPEAETNTTADSDVPQVDKRLYLFAPVDTGALAPEYPAAAVDFARSMAKQINRNVDDAEAFYSEQLPNSGDPAWQEGLPGAASGADAVIITRILNIAPVKGAAGMDASIEVMLHMQMYNAAGTLVWNKQVKGHAPDVSSVKLGADAAKPASRAALNAVKEAMAGLLPFIKSRETIEVGRPVDQPMAGDLPLIDVAFDSIPPNADIYVNGVFRGNTPTVVPLPVEAFTVRLQRQGYQSWETELVPSPDMRIQPALEPLP